MAARATGAELVARYDIRLIGDFATDEGEPLDPAAVPTHPNVIVALEDATGEFEAAVLSGDRYTLAQLDSLAGNTRNHMVRIICSIAMCCLFDRRPEIESETTKAIRERADKFIKALNNGDNILGIAEIVEAGTIKDVHISAVEVDNRNLLPSRMNRYFPGTEQRTPRSY
jgi:hypothetical protein